MLTTLLLSLLLMFGNVANFVIAAAIVVAVAVIVVVALQVVFVVVGLWAHSTQSFNILHDIIAHTHTHKWPQRTVKCVFSTRSPMHSRIHLISSRPSNIHWPCPTRSGLAVG